MNLAAPKTIDLYFFTEPVEHRQSQTKLPYISLPTNLKPDLEEHIWEWQISSIFKFIQSLDPPLKLPMTVPIEVFIIRTCSLGTGLKPPTCFSEVIEQPSDSNNFQLLLTSVRSEPLILRWNDAYPNSVSHLFLPPLILIKQSIFSTSFSLCIIWENKLYWSAAVLWHEQ